MHRALVACLLLLPAIAGAAEPQLFLFDAARLTAAKQRLAEGDAALKPALEQLLKDAEEALRAGPFSVMDKADPPPSGDKHDYHSIGPYWWPDPITADGLPYIRRDGEVNPEYYSEKFDRERLRNLCDASETLALAWWFTGEPRYAEHAAHLLRTWFLAEATRMNPNLNYGQAIRGRTAGRGIGIIDTVSLTKIPEAAGLLESSDAWKAEDHTALKAWFRDYLAWLRTSKLGLEEARQHNNHGTWYDVQVAQFALFVGEEEFARGVLEAVPAKRIDTQITSDGRQPHELARTRSFTYSTMNLRGMFALARLGERFDLDLWRYRSKDGGGLRPAIDFLAPYADPEKPWPHEQITPAPEDALFALLRQSALAYEEPKYEVLVNKMPKEMISTDRAQLLWP